MPRTFAYARVSTIEQEPENQVQEINAVAQFERDLQIERTQAGLNRAKADGKLLGRPPALSVYGV